ncbi:MAG: dipicolinate synthase subunit B [Clostridiales bacterium]|nr:dipicolinate synthase subunit B [Clostridiales bacterium]
MSEGTLRVGYAFCGSFCTFDKAMTALEKVKARYGDVYPIVSETTAATDTRFGAAHDFMREMERICGRRVISSITAAEPIGPKKLLDVMVVAPCTGSTLAKLATGVSDGVVPLAVKAHLRNGGPVVIAVSTNDGLAASAHNISTLLNRKNCYFVPFRQDAPEEKPTSLLAEFKLIPEAIEAAMGGRQLQPVLLGAEPDGAPPSRQGD